METNNERGFRNCLRSPVESLLERDLYDLYPVSFVYRYVSLRYNLGGIFIRQIEFLNPGSATLLPRSNIPPQLRGTLHSYQDYSVLLNPLTYQAHLSLLHFPSCILLISVFVDFLIAYGATAKFLRICLFRSYLILIHRCQIVPSFIISADNIPT